MGMFEKFLGELQKTLGGGPGKEGRGDVGAFERDAISGGQRALGPLLEDPLENPAIKSALAPATDSLASPYTEEDYQRMKANEGAKTQLMPAPLADTAPIEIPLKPGAVTLGEPTIKSAPTETSASEPPESPVFKKSSRAKHKADVGTSVVAESPKQTENTGTPASDPIADLLKENEAKFGKDRDTAKQAALDAEKMTDDEKLATTLLAALPGLLGLVGGAAIGGGGGAMAGLAGGLSGGATGIQGIAADKKEKRKEALANVAKAEDRLAKVGDQKLMHGEQLQEQGFKAGESTKDRTQRQAELDKRLQFEGKEGAATRANQRLLKEMDVLGDLKKAQLTAGGKGKFTEQQERTATLLPTMIQANAVASQMEANPNSIPQLSGARNALNAIAPESMESDAYKAYQNSAIAYTGSYLFKVSGAAVPEPEIKRYSQVLFARPGDSPAQVEQKRLMRDNIDSVMRSTLNGSPAEIQAALEQAGVPPSLTRIIPGVSPQAAGDVWSRGKRLQ